MEPSEVKSAIDALNRAFEEFKRTNDERIKAIEGRKAVDPLIESKLDRLNDALDAGQKALSDHFADLEAKVNKLALPGGGQTDGLSADEREQKAAFQKYLRKGTEFEQKTLSVGDDANGGYTVMPDTTGRIVSRVFETSPIRQIASVQAITSDALEGLLDLDEIDVTPVSEQGTRSQTTTTPGFKKWRVPVHELTVQPASTQQFLDDSMIDVEAWLSNKIADKMGRKEANYFVVGTGVSQPRGFASYATAATADGSRAWGTLEHVASGTSGTFGTDPNGMDKLIDLVATLNPIYLPNARFVFRRTVQATIRKMKANSQYIWLPSTTGKPEATLLGHPVTLAEDMPAIAANALAVAFGDFKAGYQIVDRQGIRVLRDPLTAKPFVLFYTTYRVGGEVVDFNAIKFLKLA
jgi:HK97 family phage major capsid protein